MTPHPLLAAALFVLALAVAFVIGAAARALILTATRHGRHEVADLPPLPPERTREELGFSARPAPGHTIYTDHNVWLPHTPAAPPRPAVWTRPQPEPAAEDDLYDLCAGCRGRDHCDGAVEFCCCTCGWDEDWAEEPEPDVDAQVAEWQHILNGRAERLASDTDIRATLCACGRPAGHLEGTLRTSSLDDIGHAFDTAQFPAVADA